jgi:C1A family cysteine protease
MDGTQSSGLGWQRDLKDGRDYRPDNSAVEELLQNLGPPSGPRRRIRDNVDLREFLSPSRDQGSLHSSCAFAVLGLVGYFEARGTGRVVDASRLFLYQMALKLLGLTGNASVDLRTTFKALVRFGTPTERYWPYSKEQFQVEPTDPFLFSFGHEYKTIRYMRLDGADGGATLRRVKTYLAAGFALTFGFCVPSSTTTEPDVCYRPQFDAIRGGQAVLAVGYDDSRRIASERGALLFQGSWGPTWGDQGCGWLPYAFVQNEFAADFWTALRTDWTSSGAFLRPAVDDA